jgi:WD40 repeat protein
MTGLAFSGDGAVLVSAAADLTVIVWDMARKAR